ncbi:hypothetical protein [Paenibacillus sedimenti]|uniref:hypothetical protein n=1 Tax=Paenibacillus sedimenti TaxID=2770274 RepID=UPI00165F2AAE|nr:hypothetical protein [Paenibacillus sedimenti]
MINVVTVASIIYLTLTLFLLYLLRPDPRQYLQRLPISKRDIFLSNALPFLGLLFVLFTIESGSMFVVMLEYFERNTHPVLFLTAFMLLILFCIQTSFILRYVVRFGAYRLKLRSYTLESMLNLLVLVLFIYIIVIDRFSLKLPTPIVWTIEAMFGSVVSIWMLALICVAQFAFIYFVLSRSGDNRPIKATTTGSWRFYPSEVANGFKLELLQLIRNSGRMGALLFYVLLGNGFVLIAYSLFGLRGQGEYAHFLIFTLGLGLSQLSTYSSHTMRTIRLLPLKLKPFIAGKMLFYIAAATLLLSISMAAMALLRMKVELMTVLMMFIELWLFVLIALLIHEFLKEIVQMNSMLQTIVSILVFLIAIEGVSLLQNKIVILFGKLLLTACFSYLYIIWFTTKKKKGKLDYDAIPG